MLHRKNCLPLLCQPFGTTVASGLVLATASLHLVGEDLGTVLLSLSFVNVLHEDAFVLEDVTLRFLVQGVI